MHDRAGESLHAWPAWGVAFRIFVIARAQEEKVAGKFELLVVWTVDAERPANILGPPRRPHELQAEANMAINAIGFRRFSEIAEDRGAVGDRCRIVPWTERVAESRHIRV
jgi:hypothetical protein